MQTAQQELNRWNSLAFAWMLESGHAVILTPEEAAALDEAEAEAQWDECDGLQR